MLKELKNAVLKANLDLVRYGLVIQTWGNVSGRDLKTGMIVIKPSGVSYDSMEAGDMIVLDNKGVVVEGKYKPSTDAPTHVILYNTYGSIGGIVHTHSVYATSWAQAGRSIPPFGTTHADHFNGDVPCTRKLDKSETLTEYEINTGRVIIEKLGKIDPMVLPSVLVNCHGPFSWGKDPEDAVNNAVALETIARMALYTVLLGKGEAIDKYLLDKHFGRKHGNDAYYGQT